MDWVQLNQTWQTLNPKVPKRRRKHVTMHRKSCCGFINEQRILRVLCVWCSANNTTNHLHCEVWSHIKQEMCAFICCMLCCVPLALLNQTNKKPIIICVLWYFAISLFETLFTLLQYPNWILFVKTIDKVLFHSMHVNRRNRSIGIHGAGYWH